MTAPPIPLRVWFAGRAGVQSLADRARGIGANLGSGFQSSYGFSRNAIRDTIRAAGSHDVLWLMSQSPLRLQAAAYARSVSGTPFIVDTGDLLAESARTAGRGALRIAAAAAWERRSLRLPDAVVVRGSAHQPIAVAAGARRVELIRDGVDPAHFARRDATAVRSRLAVQGRITLGVVSTISWEPSLRLPSPGWDIVECLARLPDLPLAAIVVGDGPGLGRLRAMAEQRGVLDRLRLIGRVPLAEIPDLLSAMDIFVHTALNNPMSAVRTTGKLPLLLASGCAAVVSKVGDAAQLLEGTGMLLDFEGSTEDYAARLAARVRALVEEGRLEEWRVSGPAMARANFDYTMLGTRAASLLTELVAGRV